MITYTEETFSDAKRDIAGLAHGHWQEVNGNPDCPLDIDWGFYARLECLDMVYVMTVRDDGKLVGYAILLKIVAPHYKNKTWAHDDAFYVLPSHRKGGIGLKLIREAVAMAVRHSCDRITFHEKLAVPVGRLFEHLGFTATETLWMKDLTNGS